MSVSLSLSAPSDAGLKTGAWFHGAGSFTQRVTPAIPAMVQAAHAILASNDLAWDAVQDALLRVWRLGLRRPSVPALRRLAALSALHLARCRRRRAFHEDRAAALEPCCPADPLADVADAEERQLLLSALARVTAQYRQVLELYELEGRDYRAIASALDLPVGTVRSRLHRARRELRSILVER
jgi:RNA polymerase sigma-70 factor (ECF subfamily)